MSFISCIKNNINNNDDKSLTSLKNIFSRLKYDNIEERKFYVRQLNNKINENKSDEKNNFNEKKNYNKNYINSSSYLNFNNLNIKDIQIYSDKSNTYSNNNNGITHGPVLF